MNSGEVIDGNGRFKHETQCMTLILMAEEFHSFRSRSNFEVCCEIFRRFAERIKGRAVREATNDHRSENFRRSFR